MNENTTIENISAICAYCGRPKIHCICDLTSVSLLSETSLKKDWLKPEEDDAWVNL